MTALSPRRAVVVALAAAVTLGTAAPALAAPAPVTAPSAASRAAQVPVIVQEQAGAGAGPQRAVAALGGTVGRQLGIIDAFTARVPAGRLAALRATPGVRAVTEDAAVHLASTDVTAQAGQSGSLTSITSLTGATQMWGKHFTGKGVDVALLDSGVVPVDGLRTSGKVVYGPDLSLEAQTCGTHGCSSSGANDLDGYGHGTAMAGIIAGRDDAAPSGLTQSSGSTDFLGVAPDARIVSVKVADASGAADVSQVIAGIDWVVENRGKNGLHIKVLNLSFGTDGVQDYQLDPLTYAAEVAWRAGIVVVVSAGNTGSANGKLANPAYDPYVLAVGAVDDGGSKGTGNDVIPSWSSRGDGTRNPDLVAPGAGVVSLRDPGSLLDTEHPGAEVGSRFFRGSGTSQAAAVVSGAAALVLSQHPALTPDQVKALLTRTAKTIPSADPVGQGHGLVDLGAALTTSPPTVSASAQSWPRATGTGSLDAARGTGRVQVGGAAVTGETDVTGAAWDATAWAKAEAAGTTWTGGTWSGGRAVGGSWNGRPWFGHAWNGDHYGGQTWTGSAWDSAPWAQPSASPSATSGAQPSASSSGAQSSMWASSMWASSMWASSMWASSMWASSMWASSMWG